MPKDERPREEISPERRKLLRASAVALGAGAVGRLPWEKPQIKSFFGVPGAWAQPTGPLVISMSGKIGTQPDGQPDPAAAQDAFEFEVFEASTQLTVTATSDDGFLDIEIYLYAPGAVGLGETNLLNGFDFGLDDNGPGGSESATVTVASPGIYTVAIEDAREGAAQIAGRYTITITGDKPLGSPLQTVDEGPESDAPVGD